MSASSPLVIAPAVPGPGRDLPRRSGIVARVAALDDHWAVRAGLEAVIGSQPDMVMVGSATGEDELDSLLRRTDPSILMLDIHHPGASGFAIALRLKRRAPSPRIVLHSGRGGTPLLTAAAAIAGMDAIVAKSCTRRELLEAIREVAHGDSGIEVSLSSRRRAAARLDPADHGILAMRLAGLPWHEIASTLGIDGASLTRRATQIIARLTETDQRVANPAAA